MKSLLFTAVTLISLSLQAQDSAEVLFIGNSYTYGNNLPVLLENVAQSMGDYIDTDGQLAGGATFATHAGNAATYTKINSRDWDFVVLQAQSQEPSFPDNQVNTSTLPYAKQLSDSVYANSICSRVMMFMTWGRENGDPQWAPISTFDGMNARLRAAYMRMADSVNASVSPVGVAWKYVRDNYPTIQLYTSDGSHPSMAGSYLAACTFYASIFRKSPVGIPFISTLDQTTAQQLQLSAEAAVMDSLDVWNLYPIEEHTQAGFETVISGGSVQFQNTSSFASNYYWDFGNGQQSNDEHPMVTYISNGTYTVQLISESVCATDTISVDLMISTLNLEFYEKALKLTALGNSMYQIDAIEGEGTLTLLDNSGRVIKQQSSKIIDLSDVRQGMYFLVFETPAGYWSVHLMK